MISCFSAQMPAKAAQVSLVMVSWIGWGEMSRGEYIVPAQSIVGTFDDPNADKAMIDCTTLAGKKPQPSSNLDPEHFHAGLVCVQTK
jgi:hypothetical protein